MEALFSLHHEQIHHIPIGNMYSIYFDSLENEGDCLLRIESSQVDEEIFILEKAQDKSIPTPSDNPLLSLPGYQIVGLSFKVIYGHLLDPSITNHLSLHGHTNDPIMTKSWFYFTIYNMNHNE